MRIERVHINGKSFYFVDGQRINSNALLTIIKGVYGQEACCKIYRTIIADGFAIIEKCVGDIDEQLIDQLERANRKIAALEQRVTELTLKSIYRRD